MSGRPVVGSLGAILLTRSFSLVKLARLPRGMYRGNAVGCMPATGNAGGDVVSIGFSADSIEDFTVTCTCTEGRKAPLTTSTQSLTYSPDEQSSDVRHAR